MKFLITTSSFDLDLPEIQSLKAAGYEPVMNPHGRRLTETEVSVLLTPEIVGMIAGVEPLTKSVLEKSANLRVISRCGAGMDNVDLDAARARGIAVLNTPEAPAAAVAELTVGLMLGALRKIPQQDAAIRAGKWDRPMGGLLGKRTVGLIGYGRIGRRVAEIVKSFGASVLFYDPAVKEGTVSLDILLKKSDIVSLHVPQTADTGNLMNRARIMAMKSGSILINTARGGLVDEDALAEALQAGHLAAAALDVFADEPYKGRLTGLGNVILTAHTGSYAAETRVLQEAEAARNLLTALMEKDRKNG